MYTKCLLFKYPVIIISYGMQSKINILYLLSKWWDIHHNTNELLKKINLSLCHLFQIAELLVNMAVHKGFEWLSWKKGGFCYENHLKQSTLLLRIWN